MLTASANDIKWLIGMTLFFGLLLSFNNVNANGLHISKINSRYFANDSGEIVLLAGTHTWQDFQLFGTSNHPPESNFDFATYLDMLKSNNLNYMRLWGWEQTKAPAGWPENYWIYPSVYVRTGPGNGNDGLPKFDLTQFDQNYFDRMREHIIDAADKGIYVDIQLFNGWSVGTKSDLNPNPWQYHPYNIANNINGINGDTNNDGNGYELNTLYIPTITEYQESYVKKVIDTVNDFDNVLYEICNEAESNSQDWQYHMINLIKGYEATKPKQHPVGMTVEYPGGSNLELFNSPADWISPNDTGGYKENPPAANGSKVVIADTDHLWGLGGDRFWAWKSFTRGLNLSYMDCYTADTLGCPISRNDPVRLSLLSNMGHIRSYADEIDLLHMTPQGSLSSTEYCLASPDGEEYIVYLPYGGSVTVNLIKTNGALSVEWFNPNTGVIMLGESINGGASRSLTAPFDDGDAVLYLYRANGDINNDGILNLADAVLALSVAVGMDSPETVYKDADVNRDGAIGLAEAVYALQYAADLR